MTTASTTKTSVFSSSIGLKATMAATGIVYVGFVFAHMAGNLQIFLGAEVINTYAYNLQHMGPMLGKSGALVWAARVFLLVCLALHVFTAIKLKMRNASARKSSYVAKNTIQASMASRYMMLSGLLILSFIVYHLLHFTFLPHKLSPAYPEMMTHTLHGTQISMHNVYGMIIASFQMPAIAIFYVLSQALLGLHLSHAVASVVQTAGFDHPRHRPAIEKFSLSYGWLIFLGNSAIPVAVLLGLLK